MKRLLMGVALSTSCFLLAACDPQRVVEHLPTPPERLICEPAGSRPAIPAEYQIDWSAVTTVAQAQMEHQRYVASIRDREGVIVGYIMQLEGKLFTCATNMEWRRDYESGLAE